MKKKLITILLLSALVLTGCGGKETPASIEPTESKEVVETAEEEMPKATENEEDLEEKYSSLTEIELDELQQLYVDFDSSLSYSDAIDYITATGLPYSEEKYNGSRTIQVAFTEGCTAQKYMKENGDYLTITYIYPKDENSINDELDKYIFDTCCYVPYDSSLTLREHTDGHYIFKLGSDLELDSSMSKTEQMLFYYNNK